MRTLVAAAVALALVTSAPGIGGQGSNAPHRFLFSYFTGNGEDGLHLASSADGLAWTPLNAGRSFLTSNVGSKLMRDPSIVLGPDERFHLVWTTGWWDKSIGVAHSGDLVTWSEPREIPVMAHEPAALNAWAPELFYDAAAGEYLIVWATTIPGRFPATDETGNVEKQGKLNHRLYYVTTKDFTTYSAAKLFFDDGFNAIDGTVVEAAPGRFALVVKDETERPVARKHLKLAFAPRPQGPFGSASAAISPDWVEGPSVLRVDDAWLLYFDEYTRQRYGGLRSTDFAAWTNVSERLRFPKAPGTGPRLRRRGPSSTGCGYWDGSCFSTNAATTGWRPAMVSAASAPSAAAASSTSEIHSASAVSRCTTCIQTGASSRTFRKPNPSCTAASAAATLPA
jgi:hypothetical protein